MFTESKSLLRVWGVPYKKKNLWLCRGGLLLFKKKKNSFWERKRAFTKKNSLQRKQKTTAEANLRKEKELSFLYKPIHTTKTKFFSLHEIMCKDLSHEL